MERPPESKRMQRSPSLPPLLPHGSPQPRSQMRHNRFTAEEKLAFGSRPFVKCSFSEAETRSTSPAPPASKSARSVASPPQAEPSLTSYSATQLQDVIERILPTEYGSFGDSANLRPSRSAGSLPKRKRALESRGNSTDDMALKPARGRSVAKKSKLAFPKDVLERFRLRVLKSHRSLHDAFAPLERRCYFTTVVGQSEVRTALSRVDTEAADELQIAVSTWPEAVTLSAFFDALVSSSPEASIWEFGAGLHRLGIWPSTSRRALEDLQRHMRSQVGAVSTEPDSRSQTIRDGVSWKRTPVAKDEEDDSIEDEWNTASYFDDRPCSSQLQELEALVERFLPLHMDSERWTIFCTYLGLRESEAKRLCTLLGDSYGVHLATGFEAVRVTVSPGASLPRLASKAIDRYNSLRGAFGTHCSDPENILHWLQFLNLVRTLDISDKAAMKLWLVLVSRMIATESNLEQVVADAKAKGAVHLEVFVRRLGFWVPGNDMLEDLKGKLRESFGNLQEARRAFRKHGLPSENTVSPAKLGEAFQAMGVTKCDPDVVIIATMNLNSKGRRERPDFDNEPVCQITDCVTLDDIVDVMRSQPGPRASDKGKPQTQTQALRRQLRDVTGRSSSGRSSSRRRRNSSAPPALRYDTGSDMQRVAEVQSNLRSDARVATVPDSHAAAPDVHAVKSADFPSQKVQSNSDAISAPQPDITCDRGIACQAVDDGRQAVDARRQGVDDGQAGGRKSQSNSDKRSVLLDATENTNCKLQSRSEGLPVSQASDAADAHCQRKASDAADAHSQKVSSHPSERTDFISVQADVQNEEQQNRLIAPPAPPSPPVLAQFRSPPRPPVGRPIAHEASHALHRQLDFEVRSPDLGACSPVVSPEAPVVRTQVAPRRARSMSPMPRPGPTWGESRTGDFKNEATSSSRSTVGPPRNAWSTGSAWHRSESVPPEANSTHQSDDCEPRLRDEHGHRLRHSGSASTLRGNAGRNARRDDIRSRFSSASIESLSSLESTPISTWGSNSRHKSKIWR